ncbi:MAG: hypothetical protein QNJ69_00460 [Gammaproteobacteria bacterium]|nr:hypothetical protein [Gammaproteobacteria bacterium]
MLGPDRLRQLCIVEDGWSSLERGAENAQANNQRGEECPAEAKWN